MSSRGFVAGLAGLLVQLCLFLGIGHAQSAVGWERAAAEYGQGLAAYRALDYTLARAAFGRALVAAQDAPRSARAQICRALGNTAFRQQRPLEAAAWYTAAIECAPRDGEAWASLEIARARAGLDPADRGDLSATVARALGSVDRAEAEWLAILGVVLFLAVLAAHGFWLGSAMRRWILPSAAVCAALVLPWAAGTVRGEDDPLFVVSSAGATLLSEPRAQATALAQLPAGSRARRIESVGEWTRVASAAGDEGWVLSETVFALRR